MIAEKEVPRFDLWSLLDLTQLNQYEQRHVPLQEEKQFELNRSHHEPQVIAQRPLYPAIGLQVLHLVDWRALKYLL